MIKTALSQIEEYRNYLLKEAGVRENLERAIDEIFEQGKISHPSAPTEIGEPATKSVAPSPAHEQKPAHEEGQTGPYITSPFGNRIHPVTKEYRYHNGIDLRAPEGTPILAWNDGVVRGAGYKDDITGNFVFIVHGEGFTTSYSHLSKVLVNKGDTVSKGQVIGLSGKTGRVNAPHLHFRMKHGDSDVDPAEYLSFQNVVGG